MRSGLVIIAALALAGCDSEQLNLPVRACIVEGSVLAGAPDAIPQAMLDAFDAVNRIWSPAKIHFQGCCPTVPIVADPDLSVGKMGEIALGTSDRESQEMIDARNACAAAWDAKMPPADLFKNGTIVIFARQLIQPSGVLAASNGVTNPNPAMLPDLCVEPRALVSAHVSSLYVVAIEDAGLKARGAFQTLPGLLAHELGHTLLLAHGDGLDNDSDGVVPPTNGARRFDIACDPGELDTATSLMSASTSATNLTPLQTELARAAARVHPARY